MKKAIAFKQPARPDEQQVDRWVAGQAAAPPKPEKVPTARLTIDIPVDLHTAFKVACVQRKTRMLDVVREHIEAWTREHGSTPSR